jgi:hypothetical protein
MQIVDSAHLRRNPRVSHIGELSNAIHDGEVPIKSRPLLTIFGPKAAIYDFKEFEPCRQKSRFGLFGAALGNIRQGRPSILYVHRHHMSEV